MFEVHNSKRFKRDNFPVTMVRNQQSQSRVNQLVCEFSEQFFTLTQIRVFRRWMLD